MNTATNQCPLCRWNTVSERRLESEADAVASFTSLSDQFRLSESFGIQLTQLHVT